MFKLVVLTCLVAAASAQWLGGAGVVSPLGVGLATPWASPVGLRSAGLVSPWAISPLAARTAPWVSPIGLGAPLASPLSVGHLIKKRSIGAAHIVSSPVITSPGVIAPLATRAAWGGSSIVAPIGHSLASAGWISPLEARIAAPISTIGTIGPISPLGLSAPIVGGW